MVKTYHHSSGTNIPENLSQTQIHVQDRQKTGNAPNDPKLNLNT